MQDQSFKIRVGEQEYIVIRASVSVEERIYRIETGCEYLFSLRYNGPGNWELTDSKVKPIDEDLVPAIGAAIEQTDMETFMA